MSGDSTHGAGAAFWALAGVANAVNASAAKTVFVENLVIVHSPATDQKIGATDGGRPVFLNKPRTPLFRQYRGETARSRLCHSTIQASRLSSGFSYHSSLRNAAMGITG
jgi:hypothetical protein